MGGNCCPILPPPLPPEVDQGRQGRYLLTDLLHGGATCWQLMTSGQGFDGLHFRIQPAFDLVGLWGVESERRKGCRMSESISRWCR